MKSAAVILSAAFAVIAPGLALPAHAQTVCDDVHKLVGLAGSNFAAIKGQLDGDTGHYATTFKLPNASSCVVDDDGDSARFTCEWKYGSQKEAAQAQKGLVDSVRPCLTPIRERALNVPSSNAVQWIAGTRFKLAGDMSVGVSAYQSKGLIGGLGGAYVLSFNIDHT
jgi:hypothetical protein